MNPTALGWASVLSPDIARVPAALSSVDQEVITPGSGGRDARPGDRRASPADGFRYKMSLMLSGRVLAPFVAAFIAGAVLSTPMAIASVSTAPVPATATAAFGRWLQARYGDLHGYWTCPRAQIVNSRIDCLAEVQAGPMWHQTSASARVRGGRIVFFNVSDSAWLRHWWPFSRRFIIRSHENVPGVISVNSPAYDWGWIARGAHGTKPGHMVRVDGYDGYGAGLFRFFTFTCTAHAGLITCVNALGDAMRYRPR